MTTLVAVCYLNLVHIYIYMKYGALFFRCNQLFGQMSLQLVKCGLLNIVWSLSREVAESERLGYRT